MTAPGTVGAALAEARCSLAEAGIGQSRFEARLLMGRILGADQAAVIADPERGLDRAQRRRWRTLVARRCRREPMAHIIGMREFWSLEFKTTRDTLIPRPESETVVESALAWITKRGDGRAPGVDRQLDILDLGTGSGCLLLALLSELPDARGTGVDISRGALRVARTNSRALGLAARARFVRDDWRRADWGRDLPGRFDMIVANPPYVAEGTFASLQTEVTVFEPRLALCGGADGLDEFRAVLPRIGALLSPAGGAFIEVGAGQAAAVADMARSCDLQVIGVADDLAGIPRCVAIVPQNRLAA